MRFQAPAALAGFTKNGATNTKFQRHFGIYIFKQAI
jgi:hypothetical protein